MNEKYRVDVGISGYETKTGFSGSKFQITVGLSLGFYLTEILPYTFTGATNPSNLLSCSIKSFEYLLLYDASNPRHRVAAKHSPYPIKFYYIQEGEGNEQAIEWGDTKPTDNYVIIRGQTSFVDFQTAWKENLRQIMKNKEREALKIPENVNIPADLICPLTKKIFVDPVKVPEAYKAKLFPEHPKIVVIERAMLEGKLNQYNHRQSEQSLKEVLPYPPNLEFSALDTYEEMESFRTQHGVRAKKHEKIRALQQKLKDQIIPETRFITWEDFLNPSHFVLLSFILLFLHLLPAALLLSSAVIGFIAIPAAFSYLAIKIYKDFQLFNEILWDPLVEAQAKPTKSSTFSLMSDPLAAQTAMQEEITDNARWKVLAYLKALPARFVVWAQMHPVQAVFVFLSLGFIVSMIISCFSPTPLVPIDFISHFLSNGIHEIIAWSPDKLAFLNVLATEMATHIMAIGAVIIGALSICDNVRRIGRAGYTAYGNITKKFDGPDEDDFIELQDSFLEVQFDTAPDGKYSFSNPVANSYVHTINWHKPLESDQLHTQQVDANLDNKKEKLL